MWDDLKGEFINHLDQVNADLKAAGLPDLNAREI
jgi:homogentisate 1,2-dioxygenase